MYLQFLLYQRLERPVFLRARWSSASVGGKASSVVRSCRTRGARGTSVIASHSSSASGCGMFLVKAYRRKVGWSVQRVNQVGDVPWEFWYQSQKCSVTLWCISRRSVRVPWSGIRRLSRVKRSISSCRVVRMIRPIFPRRRICSRWAAFALMVRRRV